MVCLVLEVMHLLAHFETASYEILAPCSSQNCQKMEMEGHISEWKRWKTHYLFWGFLLYNFLKGSK